MCLLTFAGALGLPGSEARAQAPDHAANAPAGALQPEVFPAEADLNPPDSLRLAPLFRPHAAWAQLELAGSFFDLRRELISPRINIALASGYRFGKLGLLGLVEYDHSWDFSQNTDTLALLKAGLGGEYLYVLGHARTTVIAGWTLLLQDTALDDSGVVGWFVDVRPISIRWGFGESTALELTPVGLDLSVPVTDGIPLVLVSFLTRFGIEWSFQ